MKNILPFAEAILRDVLELAGYPASEQHTLWGKAEAEKDVQGQHAEQKYELEIILNRKTWLRMFDITALKNDRMWLGCLKILENCRGYI